MFQGKHETLTQLTEWVKILTNPTSNKEFVSIVSKKTLQLYNEKTTKHSNMKITFLFHYFAIHIHTSHKLANKKLIL